MIFVPLHSVRKNTLEMKPGLSRMDRFRGFPGCPLLFFCGGPCCFFIPPSAFLPGDPKRQILPRRPLVHAHIVCGLWDGKNRAKGPRRVCTVANCGRTRPFIKGFSDSQSQPPKVEQHAQDSEVRVASEANVGDILRFARAGSRSTLTHGQPTPGPTLCSNGFGPCLSRTRAFPEHSGAQVMCGRRLRWLFWLIGA